MGIRAVIFDDLDGSVPAETVSFALYGAEYQLDLSSAHRALLEDALAPFIAAAQHRDSGTPLALESAGLPGIEPAVADYPIEPAALVVVEELISPDLVESAADVVADEVVPDPAPETVPSSLPTATEVRTWAAEHGLGLGSRGPVTSSVLGEYLSAHDLPADTTLAPAASTKPRKKPNKAAKASKSSPKATKTAQGKTAKTIKPTRSAQAKKTASPPATADAGAPSSIAVRQWANRHGLPTSATGPLPRSVTEAFAEAIETTAPKRNKSRVYPEGIREWARQNGYTVGNGKISDEVLAAYTAAH